MIITKIVFDIFSLCSILIQLSQVEMEILMYKVILLLFAVSSLFSVENSFGTHGYLRIQTSLQDQKENICFKAPGAATKYRLGNECETWGELSLFQDITLDNGVVIHNEFMPVFSAANNKTIDYFRTDQLFSEVFNLFDNSVSFWVGRRWHQRFDSHITDYFFFAMSGDGFGMNKLDLGEVKLSYSFMFNNIDPSTISGGKDTLFTSHDLRFLKEFERGELTLFLNYMQLNGETFHTGAKIDGVDGYALGLIYKDTQIFQELFALEGTNISGVFYGEGLARGAGSYTPYLQEPLIESMINKGNAIEDSKTYRFINYNDVQEGDFGVMSNFVYEYKDDKNFSNTKQEWLSIGARPYWFFHKNVRALLEVGYDTVKNKVNNETYSLLKTSTALEFALDKGIWQRPVLRLFYTHASWSNNAKGLIGTPYYANETSGTNLGVQLEYWW